MASHHESAFSVLLQSYRLAAGLTQEELAGRAGLSARGISDLERGLIQRPQARTTSLIVEALGLATYDREVFIETARHGAGRPAKTLSPPSLPSGSYLGAVPIGPLIERQMEMKRIAESVADGLQGTARLILLSGEPGIGKTRLAQETMLLLRERGFLVATGRCYEAEAGAPFYPFLDVLAKLYRTVPQAIRTVIPVRWPYLARLLPGEGLAVPPAIGDGQDQHQLFRAVTGFVQTLAAEIPVAILLDDLHWADRGTLNLLKHLVRDAQAHRILVLGTLRTLDESSPPALMDSIVDWRHDGVVEDIAVPLLTIEGTAGMVRSMVSGAIGTDGLLQALHTRAEGNPFFIQELVRALVDRGALEDREAWRSGDTDSELPLPETVRLLVQQRLARLEAASQDVLGHASILGQTFRFDDLQAFCKKSEEAVEMALEDGRAASLVRIVDRDRYIFSHALIHSALYAGLPPRKRRRLHRAAGFVLESLPRCRQAGRASTIARHFREGEDIERTLPWTMAAGDEAAAIFAHAEAEGQYRAGLALLGDVHEAKPEQHAMERQVLIRLGHVLTMTAHHDQAEEILNRAAAQSSAAGDLNDLARAIAGLADVHRGRGTTSEGIEIIAPLLERLSSNEITSEVGTEVFVALANLFFTAGRYDDLLWAAECAVVYARQTGSDWLLAEAEGRRGLALIALNRFDEAREVTAAVVPLAETSGNLRGLARAYTNLASVEGRTGHLRTALMYRERCLEVVERLRQPNFLVATLSHLAGAHMWLGQWDEARQHYTRALETACSLESSSNAPYPYFGLGNLCVGQGDFVEGARLAEHGLALAERSGDLQVISFLERVLADANIMQGQPECARNRLIALQMRLGSDHPSICWVLPSLAEAHLALDELDLARDVAANAVERATATKQQLLLVDSLRAQARVLAQLRQWDEAETVLLESMGFARGLPYPFGVARTLEELGVMLSRKGDEQRAAPLLDEAQSIYRQLGAAAYYRD